MAQPFKYLVTLFLLLFVLQCSHGLNPVQKRVFRSPAFVLEPGQASNKIYFNIGFPKGHIAIKSFDAEIVDAKGNSVPLYDTYLHHWVVIKYRQEIKNLSNFNTVPISGVCNRDSFLVQYFGLGSETRKTRTHIPYPYGIEAGNPAEVPAGYQDRWLLNVHAIDTRGVVDRRGCLECTCSLYSNITMNGPLPANYGGGLKCCTDGARCKLNEGYMRSKKTFYLKYTITYVKWDASVVPVRVYILDVTDRITKGNESTGIQPKHNCQVEYDVNACPGGYKRCIDSEKLTFDFGRGGDVIYGVGHLHIGGSAIALYGEGGREICKSKPKYGKGRAPGNEAGYVVGMTTCYPRPGSVKISTGETVTLVSNYSSTVRHTGVMSLFYLLVADSQA